MLFVFALLIGAIVSLARAIRPKPKPQPVNSKPMPHVNARPHDDMGEQTIELDPNSALPTLHLRVGQGILHYTIETGNQGKSPGE